MIGKPSGAIGILMDLLYSSVCLASILRPYTSCLEYFFIIHYAEIMSKTSEVDHYRMLLSQTVSQLDSIIYEIEDYTMNPRSRLKEFQDLKFDAIPILRKLKDARKYAQQSYDHYETF